MTFQKEKIADFLQLFESNKQKIRNFKGCLYLRLMQDLHTENVFFTYSHWENENDLENYRKSELFQGVWANTKLYFLEKPEAWSVKEIVCLD